jgi:outer membrane protein assembly factor BamB
MSGNLLKGKFCLLMLVTLILLAASAGGVIPVLALQDGSDKKINPWEKPISKCWSYDAEIVPNIPLVPGEKGSLYIPLAEGGLAAVETATGKQVWQSGLGGEIRSVRLAEGGRLMVVTAQQSEKKDDHSLFLQALSEETGITAWRKELEFSGKVYLLTKGGIAVLIGEDGNITAFSAADGSALWKANPGVKVTAQPAVTEKSFIIPAAEDKKLIETGAETGKAGQTYVAPVSFSGPVLATGDAIVFSDPIGNIYSVSLINGDLIWKARAGAEVSDVSATDLGLLVSSNDNFVYMLSANRGDRKWKRKFSGRLLGKPVIHGNYGLFVTVAGTDAVILDLTSGKFVNGVSLANNAFFTGAAASSAGGFSLSTSQGVFFYSPEGCIKK